KYITEYPKNKLRKLKAWLLLEVRPFLLGAMARKQLNEVDGAFTKSPIRKDLRLRKRAGD
ncbi:unnamed protein product, partial [marine sediment metagenome]